MGLWERAENVIGLPAIASALGVPLITLKRALGASGRRLSKWRGSVARNAPVYVPRAFLEDLKKALFPRK